MWLMRFGDVGGKESRFGESPVGGKQLIIKSGTVVDSIKLGTNVVGGDGGSETVNLTLPSDGFITLYTVSTKYSISFLFLNHFLFLNSSDFAHC